MAFLLHQLLSETAAKYPEKEAVLFNKESVTYLELEKTSSRLANLLIDRGVKPQDRVAIYMPRNINSIIAVFGILKTGATYVPIDPFCPESRLNYIVNQCEIEFMLSAREKLPCIEKSFPGGRPLKNILLMDGSAEDSKTGDPVRILSWPKEGTNYSQDKPETQIPENSLSYILFTSGSTGLPKGVMISHLNATAFINMACNFFTIGQKDILANVSPLHFDLSMFDIYAAFKVGASVAIAQESVVMFPSKLTEFIQNNRITIWNSVPSMLSLLVAHADLDKFDFSTLRLVLFAGEVFPVKYLRILKEHMPDAQFYNIYGQTEANSSTYFPVNDILADDAVVIPIGKPFPGFEVFALDENGRKISAAGEKGELYVEADTVASGYWKDPGRTREKFVRNPLKPEADKFIYRTGDIVKLDDKGNYVFLGRVDQMIKSRGYRIEIGEIETVLSSHPLVKSAVVVPIPDELIGNRIAAVIVPSKESVVKKEDILRYCAKQLPKYMIPETLEFQDALPMTSSGKADRKKLLELMQKGKN